jgi:hypothetical protein
MKTIRFLLTYLFLLLSLASCRKDIANERNKFIESAELTVGTIKYLVYSRHGNSYVTYSYIVDDSEYAGKDGQCGFDSSEASSKFYKVKEGEKYLVFFKKDEPEKSLIRLDYPITDSADFKRYEIEFR